MSAVRDVMSGRLPHEALRENFGDVHPPLEVKAARVEAGRCLYCFDAPCVEACPTGIDIPGFIHKISTGNVKGAAVDILSENIFGGTCARVCPTEILCEGACVRNDQDLDPVQIGALQRFATDWLSHGQGLPFERGAASGKRVAVVGAGPAGMACAHRLSMLGHEVVVFEAREKSGGLNEFGIAAYKMADNFAQRELEDILDIGGIAVKYGQALGRDITLSQLRAGFDAVFLGMGLAGVRALEMEGEELAGVMNAVDYIRDLRQADDLSTLPVGRRVVVVGGGNTAIDMAVQIKRLGAEEVTLVYRRGEDAMSATWHEREFALTNGVTLRTWARPMRLIGEGGQLVAAEFETTRLDGEGRLQGAGKTWRIGADMLFKAIGQTFLPDPLRDGEGELLELAGGRIMVAEDRATSLAGVYAGGDCVANGEDLTVAAVQDGKLAAHAIDRYFGSK